MANRLSAAADESFEPGIGRMVREVMVGIKSS
jgi:hypothetical protein